MLYRVYTPTPAGGRYSHGTYDMKQGRPLEVAQGFPVSHRGSPLAQWASRVGLDTEKGGRGKIGGSRFSCSRHGISLALPADERECP